MPNTVKTSLMGTQDGLQNYYQFEIQSPKSENYFILLPKEKINQDELKKIEDALKDFNFYETFSLDLELALNTNRKPEEVKSAVKSAEEIIANHLKEKDISINPNEIIFNKSPDPKLIDQVELTKSELKNDENKYTFQINQTPKKTIYFTTKYELNEKQLQEIKELINELHIYNEQPTQDKIFTGINKIIDSDSSGLNTLPGYIEGTIRPSGAGILYSFALDKKGEVTITVEIKNGVRLSKNMLEHFQNLYGKSNIDSLTGQERKDAIKRLQENIEKYYKTLGDDKLYQEILDQKKIKIYQVNLVGVSIVDHKNKTAVISFAPNPKDPKKLIYRIEIEGEKIYFQANKRLTDRNLEEIADKAVNLSLPKESISGYFNKKGIQANVIDPTSDIVRLSYTMPMTFNLEKNQQENPNPNPSNPNPNPNPQQRVW